MAAAPVARPAVTPLPAHAVDKWDVLRDLATARTRFSLSDRDLAVLQALLSFYPGAKLDDPQKLVVFPSNATLCARLNGMPCSTMRRHLSRLLEAGLITRRDSPNGKRYRRREGPAFGLDLTPLACRAAHIRRLAVDVQAEQQCIAVVREQLSLLRRDLIALLAGAEIAEFSPLPDMVGKALRRKMTLPQLESLRAVLREAVDKLAASAALTDDPGSTDIQNEQHQYITNKKNPDSEKSIETVQDVSLAEVMATCDQMQTLSEERIESWHMLVRVAERLRPMLGIGESVWRQAIARMGAVTAAVALAGILQRFDQIRTPAAYLNALAMKAANGEFSAVQMIRSLSLQSSQL